MCQYMSKVKNKTKIIKTNFLSLVMTVHNDPFPALNALVVSILNFPLHPA